MLVEAQLKWGAEINREMPSPLHYIICVIPLLLMCDSSVNYVFFSKCFNRVRVTGLLLWGDYSGHFSLFSFIRLNYSSVDRNTITRVIEVKTMVVCSPSIKTVGGWNEWMFVLCGVWGKSHGCGHLCSWLEHSRQMEQYYSYAAGVPNTPLFMMSEVQYAPGAVVWMYFFFTLSLVVKLAASLCWVRN